MQAVRLMQLLILSLSYVAYSSFHLNMLRYKVLRQKFLSTPRNQHKYDALLRNGTLRLSSEKPFINRNGIKLGQNAHCMCYSLTFSVNADQMVILQDRQA